MAESGILREFLVQLGFKVDQQSSDKFSSAVVSSTKRVGELGLAIEGAAGAVLAFTIKTSAALEKLYWEAERTGTSAAQIQKFTYSLSQMGGTAEEGHAALEGFANFLRTTPNADGIVRTILGANYVMKDAATTARDLGIALGKLPYWRAQPYYAMLGWDTNTALALGRGPGGFDIQSDEMNKRLGLNMQQATQTGLDMMRQWRTTEEIVKRIQLLLGQKLAAGGLIDELSQFNQYLLAHGDEITTTLLEVADDVLAVAKGLNEAIQATLGWRGAIDLVLALMGLQFAARIVSPFVKLTEAVLGTSRALSGVGGALSILTAPEWLLGLLAAAGLYEGYQYLKPGSPGAPGTVPYVGHGYRPPAAAEAAPAPAPYFNMRTPEGRAAHNAWLQQQSGAVPGAAPAAPASAPGINARPANYNPADVRGDRNNNPLNLTYVSGQGAIGHDSRFGIYRTLEEGIAANERQLLRYQDVYKRNTIAEIINKWAPGNENDTASYISNVSRSTGYAANAQIDLHDPAILSALVDAMAKVEVGHRLTAEALNRGTQLALGRKDLLKPQITITAQQSGQPVQSSAPVVNHTQTVNNNITTADASGIAGAIGASMSRANQDLVRYTRMVIA